MPDEEFELVAIVESFGIENEDATLDIIEF